MHVLYTFNKILAWLMLVVWRDDSLPFILFSQNFNRIYVVREIRQFYISNVSKSIELSGWILGSHEW